MSSKSAYIRTDGIYPDANGQETLKSLSAFEGDTLIFYNQTSADVTITAQSLPQEMISPPPIYSASIFQIVVPKKLSTGFLGKAQVKLTPTIAPTSNATVIQGASNYYAYNLIFPEIGATVQLNVNNMFVTQTAISAPGTRLTVVPSAFFYFNTYGATINETGVTLDFKSAETYMNQSLFNGFAPTTAGANAVFYSGHPVSKTVASISSPSTTPPTYSVRVGAAFADEEGGSTKPDAAGDPITIVIDTMGAGSGQDEQ